MMSKLQLFRSGRVVVVREIKSDQMAEIKRGERLQIMLTQEELRALDDWRFGARMPSRAAAIRELLKRGLAAEGFLSADGDSKSSDFGVTGDTTSASGDRG